MINIKIDWKTATVIVVAIFLYKIGNTIWNYGVEVWNYTAKQISSILNDPAFLVVIGIILVVCWYETKMKNG